MRALLGNVERSETTPCAGGCHVMRTRVVVIVLSSMIFGGCSTKSKRHDWVAGQWRETMRLYHISPVYPPTEDIHVGDLFAVANCKASADEGTRMPDCNQDRDLPFGKSVKLTHIDVKPELAKFYKSVTASELKAISGNESASFINAVDRPDLKLPLAALPGFSLYNSNRISGGIAAGLWRLAAGANKEEATSVRIDGVRTYGLPAYEALAVLMEYCGKAETMKPEAASEAGVVMYACHAKTIKNALQSQLHFGGKPDQHASLMMIARVYVADSISYTYSAESSIGAQGKTFVDLAKILASVPAATDVAHQVMQQNVSSQEKLPTTRVGTVDRLGSSATRTVQGAPSTLAHLPGQVMAGVDPLSGIIQAVNGLLAVAAPGGATLSITSVSAAGVTLTQKFDRPIAIGFRAVSVRARCLNATAQARDEPCLEEWRDGKKPGLLQSISRWLPRRVQ